jgi:phage FluMu gp28-like protein
MYAVEFQAPIENGIVRIPKQYQEIQDNKKATFVVMYNSDKTTTKQNSINDELDELFANSNNKVQVTMELATNTDEMINDGIL